MSEDANILLGAQEDLLNHLDPFQEVTARERIANCFAWTELHFQNIDKLQSDAQKEDLTCFEELFNKFIKRKKKDVFWGVGLIISSLIMWLAYSFFIEPPHYVFWSIVYLAFTAMCIHNGLKLITSVTDYEAALVDVIIDVLDRIKQYVLNTRS